MDDAPAFFTTTKLARLANLHRTVVTRIVAQGLMKPDAFCDGQPVFSGLKIIEVLRAARPLKERFPL